MEAPSRVWRRSGASRSTAETLHAECGSVPAKRFFDISAGISEIKHLRETVSAGIGQSVGEPDTFREMHLFRE